MVDPIPVSRPPAPNWTPEVPNDPAQLGKRHGTQARASWRTGDSARKQVIDSVLAESLWRISIEGIGGLVLIDIEYGTSARRQIRDIQSPMVLAVPGIVQIYVRPDNPGHEGMECRVTLTPATASGIAHCRKIADAGVAPVPLDDGAVRFVALSACAVEISGTAVAVPTLGTVPLIQGSILNSGRGYQEFEA
jgi:hypothetical protein